MELKRQYARGTPVATGIVKIRKGNRELSFEAVNMSASGLLIESDEAMEVGEAVAMRLDVTGGFFEKTLSFEGVVLRKNREGDRWQHAIEIKKIAPNDRIQIDEMITHLNQYSASISGSLVFDEDEDSDLAANWPTQADDQPDQRGHK